MTNYPIIKNALYFAAVLLFVAGCHQWDNFTTYYNTYYNAERLMKKSEEEFDYYDEKKRVSPRIFVPKLKEVSTFGPTTGPPPFMQEFIVSQQKRQAVAVKLDSIIIKGSKILANHPRSDYIQGTLYLMAKSYFYREEWIPAQIKCSELIDRYPGGEKSPDAHLLLSKTLLIQRKFYSGKIMLSRTVDIAWQLERYDILSQAFRIQADLALYQNDREGALRPYMQAIAQSENDTYSARWQVDLAALLYRLGEFEYALKEFRKVHNYTPDYVTEFEANLYEAACLTRLEEYDKSTEILYDLEADRNNEEWLAYIFAEHMQILRENERYNALQVVEEYADTAFGNLPPVLVVYYETGMDYYENSDYKTAMKYFARSRNVRTPVFDMANRMHELLASWEYKINAARPRLNAFMEGEQQSDTTKATLALLLFELGRIHEQLGNLDSAQYYYKYSSMSTPPGDKRSARYIFAYSRMFEESDPRKKDSLLEVLVQNYPLTDYGEHARNTLGYTESFVVDTVYELYSSGVQLMQYGNYPFSIDQFKRVYREFPKSRYAPKSLYTIGWVFEKHLDSLDSALHYYQLLIDKYPRSEYAMDVRTGVEYMQAVNSGGPIPDSLKPKKVIQYVAPSPEKYIVRPKEMAPPKPKDGDGMNIMDVFKDPGKALESIKNAPQKMFEENKKRLEEGVNDMKDIKIPTSTDELMDEVMGDKKDSTKSVKPDGKTKSDSKEEKP
jgi:tetratricopeptide (TPR) repeat protein